MDSLQCHDPMPHTDQNAPTDPWADGAWLDTLEECQLESLLGDADCEVQLSEAELLELLS